MHENDRTDAGGAPHPVGATPPHEAVIFDMDGVVTDTAVLHAQAWKQLFDEVLSDARLAGGRPYAPFDVSTDYRRHVDGRPRKDGVAAVLAARGIALPPGASDDPPDAWTVAGLAARKNAIFLDLLGQSGVRAFPATVDLMRRLRSGGVRLGLVTASRNAPALLAAAHVDTLFDVVVDGGDIARLGLPGKPAPDTFLHAAALLGVEPGRVAVVEDAIAGVEAGRRGGFGLVVGIDRVGQRAALEAAGAHVVVQDASQLDLGALRADPWILAYEGFDPAHEGHREALTTLANGYLGTRGAAPEHSADGVHYPGTYIAGVYNRLVSHLHGHDREDEHLVNVPNWLVLDLRVGEGDWWSAGGLTTTEERRELDLRRGILTRTAVLTDAAGHRLRVTQRRLVSMARPHLAALETTVVPDGWDGALTIRSGVDAGVRNQNVAEYAELADRHLRTADMVDVGNHTVAVEAETVQSGIRVTVAARTTVRGVDGAAAPVMARSDDAVAHVLEIQARTGMPVTVDKTVAVFTSKDPAIAAPRLGALDELASVPGGLVDLLAAHEGAWSRLWDRFAVDLDADRQTQLVLNLHVFHLLQSVSPHTMDADAGVPVRGLHGEGYRGHVFWDELFVLPVLTTHLPWVSRALLEYRFRRLGAARRAAADAGHVGAMFPWQSGSDGREETPTQLFNSRSGRWMPDNSRRQRHVGLAVAFNAWKYFEATGDLLWLLHRGADLIVEVTRFFASIATYDPGEDRFHLTGLMGPDEYHDGYPDSPGQGLRDNTYTNVLASWVCARAVDVLTLTGDHDPDDVEVRLGIGPDEAATWEHMSRRLFLPFHADGILSQFDGYAALAELDWDAYRQRYENIGRLDLILEAEGRSTNAYKLAKQADVLMLVYLLGPEVLLSALDRLGYVVDADILGRTVAYYLARTAHGSTLSRVVHASVLARMDPEHAWETFRDALGADLDDTQGGTTSEGIHLGAMAGTVDVVARAFGGVHTEGDTVVLDPHLPAELRRARFLVEHRNHRLRIELTHGAVSVTSQSGPPDSPLTVRVGNAAADIPAERTHVFST